MSKEAFCSGYCRQIDASRMVEVVVDHGHLEEVDCGYETCIFKPQCPIAASVRQLLEEQT